MTLLRICIISLCVTFTGCANESNSEKIKRPPLHWEKESIQVEIPTGKNLAEGWFVFTNQSKVPIRILAVESDCDCLITNTDLKIYYPDESGVLIASIELKPDETQTSKTIKVTSKPGSGKVVTTLLHLIAKRT